LNPSFFYINSIIRSHTLNIRFQVSLIKQRKYHEIIKILNQSFILLSRVKKRHDSPFHVIITVLNMRGIFCFESID